MTGALLTMVVALAAAQHPAPPRAAALDARAYEAAYNLDYDQALALSREAVALAPADPSAHRTLATVLWLDVIFLRGAVTIDPYLDNVLHGPGAFSPPPVAIDLDCREETAKAIDLAEAWTKREPKNLDAEVELGAAYALRASYVASVTGDLSGAFGAARHAYDDDNDVYTRDPSRATAAVVVGLYRYIVSTLALPSRLFAYVVGFAGDKAKGIGMLETAAAGQDGHVEASVALLLIYAREKRHQDALSVALRLEHEYPRNRLFTLEAGSAAVRAGQGGPAELILSRGLAALGADARPRFPGEVSLWHLKRGMARMELGHLGEARQDLEAASAAGPAGWMAGRIHLELGKVDDLEGRRKDALAEYHESRRLCDAVHNGACAEAANHLLDKPFHGGSGGTGVSEMERSVPIRR